MTGDVTLFRVEGSAADALENLSRELRLAEDQGRRERETWFDTFDWELAARGWRLCRRQVSGRDELVLEDVESGGAPLVQPLEDGKLPAGRLPAGPVSEKVLPAAGLRSVLPQLTVERRVRGWRVLDGEDKTVVRLELWEGSVKDLGAGGARPPVSGAAAALLPGVLAVRALRGYDADHRRVRDLCARGLSWLAGDALDLALESCGRDRDRERKPTPMQLEPGERSDVALARLLRALAEAVASNVPGTLADLDTEFLHDLRVAVRRTRSALSQVKRVLPDPPLERFRGELQWLGTVTGPVRDLDVFLLGFDGLEAQVSPGARGDLEPLREHLVRSRERERGKLVRSLRSKRARLFLEEWPNFLEEVADRRQLSGAEKGASPVARVAARRIAKTAERLRNGGRAISENSVPEELHALRIQGKKLRYLLELFRSLLDGERYARQHTALKRLQSVLGDYNDCAVQEEALARFAQELRGDGSVPTATLLAIGRLAERIAIRGVELRTRFSRLFEEFDDPKLRHDFEGMVDDLAQRGGTREGNA